MRSKTLLVKCEQKQENYLFEYPLQVVWPNIRQLYVVHTEQETHLQIHLKILFCTHQLPTILFLLSLLYAARRHHICQYTDAAKYESTIIL